MRTARSTFDGGRRWGNLRQTEHHVLEPRQRDRPKDKDEKQNQGRSIQPYAKTSIVSLGIISQPRELIIIEVAVVLLTAQAFGINRRAGLPYPTWKTPKSSGTAPQAIT